MPGSAAIPASQSHEVAKASQENAFDDETVLLSTQRANASPAGLMDTVDELQDFDLENLPEISLSNDKL